MISKLVIWFCNVLWYLWLMQIVSNHLNVYGQNSREINMCPYLKIAGKSRAILCWLCGSPKFLKAHAPGSIIEYDCCPGYEKSTLINNKCILAGRSWQPIIEFLRDRENPETAQVLEKYSNVPDLGHNPANKVYTVFVPKNDDDIKLGEVDYSRTPGAAEFLVSPGRWYSRQFRNGLRIPTTKKSDLKVTTYSTGLIFLECKLLMSPDHETANGLVHFIDGPLPPTYQNPTVLKRLVSEPDLSSFTHDIPNDLKQLLDTPNSNTWYTVFAPTNAEWERETSHMTSKEAKEALVREHILEKLICADAILKPSNRIGPMVSKNYITVTRDSSGRLFLVDKCQKEIPIQRKDLMSGTGVIHVLDAPLNALQVANLDKTLQCMGNDPSLQVSRAASEMRKCGLNVNPGKNTIVLLPKDEAFKSRSYQEHAIRWQSESSFRCQVYAYHILQTKQPQYAKPEQSSLVQELQLATQYTAPGGVKPPVAVRYIKERDGTLVVFNGAESKDIRPVEFENGVIYTVNRINFPPEKDIISLIEEEPNTRVVSGKLDDTGFQSELSRLAPNVLFLAPVDRGWNSRDEENQYTNVQMRKLLQLHTIPHALFGGNNGFIGRESVQEVDSLLTDGRGQNFKLLIKRNPDGNTFIGYSGLPENLWPMVLKWNKIGTNGMVWIIDWPMRCPDGLC